MMRWRERVWCVVVSILIFFLTVLFPIQPSLAGPETPAPEERQNAGAGGQVFLPMLLRRPAGNRTPATLGTPRVNVPYFQDRASSTQAAVFWFGHVNERDNYADVRIAYTRDELWVRVAVVDYYLWYQKDAALAAGQITEWDAVSLYLNLDGNRGNEPGPRTYRLSRQLSHENDDRLKYQTGYRGESGRWTEAGLSYTTDVIWRGEGLNVSAGGNRGWAATFHIPFASLGLSGAPDPGTVWGLGVVIHDRDDAAGSPISDKFWPVQMKPASPGTWGELSFGLPSFTPPTGAPAGTTTIRHRENGVLMQDGVTGGGTACGGSVPENYYWQSWGNQTSPEGEDQAIANVQNQYDIADWPCFSKYYLTIPLDSIPRGKVIHSAKLTLRLMGSSGGGKWGNPDPSLIQAYILDQDWQESSLTWNNAPLPVENVSQAWVDALVGFPGWNDLPAYEWDLSRAVAGAYATGQPLRLVFYSADGQYHSGKYFVTTDAEDWNDHNRPQLEVEWGNP